MKQLLPKVPGLAILALFIQTSGFAQQEIQDRDDDSPRKYDEITIRHKSGKDAKVTIEIKDGDVFVNGKPVNEFEDSTLTIHRRKIMRYGNAYSFTSPDAFFSAPDALIAPGDVQVFPNQSYGKGWSYNNNDVLKDLSGTNRAMLGVGTEKKDGVNGAKVTQVTKGSTAEKMGLKVGDIITKVDDEEIDEATSLFNVIGRHEAGDKVTITYMRDGKEQKATGELGKGRRATVEPMSVYNFQMPDMPEIPRVEMPRELRMLYGNSLKFGIRAQDAEDGKGVKVLDVDDGSTAAKAGIKEGDVITRFDGKDINSVTALTETAYAAKEKVSVKVTIVRDGKAQEIDVKVPRLLRTADL